VVEREERRGGGKERKRWENVAPKFNSRKRLANSRTQRQEQSEAEGKDPKEGSMESQGKNRNLGCEKGRIHHEEGVTHLRS